MTTRTRGQRGPNVPLATREDILATMDTEGAIEQARRLGLETDTVRKIRARDGDPTTRSLRQLIVRLLDDHPYADSEALLRDIRHHDPVGQWRGVDLHSLQHQLGSMQRLALIRAARRRNGAFSVLTDIRLRNHARVVAHDAQATTQDVDPPTNVSDVTLEDATPTVDLPTSWPILEALRAAVDAQVDVREKVAALMSAAEALDAVDPDAAELLVDRAASLAPDDLSPVEFEYLQFATTHGGDA